MSSGKPCIQQSHRIKEYMYFKGTETWLKNFIVHFFTAFFGSGKIPRFIKHLTQHISYTDPFIFPHSVSRAEDQYIRYQLLVCHRASLSLKNDRHHWQQIRSAGANKRSFFCERKDTSLCKMSEKLSLTRLPIILLK